MKPNRELWVERILTGFSAVVGIVAVIGAIYGGVIVTWLAMKHPEAFAILAGAALIAAALYFRGPVRTYNLQMSHPETERVMAAILKLTEGKV